MPRIRRKLSIFIITLFLIFIIYLLSRRNSSPFDKDETNLVYIQSKLEALENGLQHHQVEVGEIRKQINTIQETNINGGRFVEPIQQPKPQLDNRDMFKDSVIQADETFNHNTNEEKCALKRTAVPNPDLQMLDIYRELDFKNEDGGVWKQGFRISYDQHDWNSHHKLKVFVVPHSHNDPGWINTFDEYYERSTKSILQNMLRHLDMNERMTFIWAEISYFQKWYEALSDGDRVKIKRIVERKQMEFVTGGWVMTDEANSHWLSMLQQLTEGQVWLKKHFNVTPATSWSIDPFGQSATMPFLLKNSNFKNLLIQRTHYSVKKRLAHEQELEFRWRQLWDQTGDTELFTHMMPFYSYDIPHTCGPDPKVCCQFDFKRLPGYGPTCPWRIAPQVIKDDNVAKKAELIVDQWRKKSTLYKTRSVLIPLGDDFRYSQSVEWEAQMTNYEKLFDYINNEPNLNTEAKFATLSEYFESVHKEKELEDFPSLSGDFFTYADRDDHYWSGYFTSRPYHKRLDRVLMHYLRSAELLRSWDEWDKESGFDTLLEEARRELSLFQHHDGITGTAKDYVMQDYLNRMIKALKNCKFVMQQSVYRLLTRPTFYQPDFKFTYFNIDESRSPGPDDSHSPGVDDSRPTIVIGPELLSKHVVIHNSLPYYRDEIVEFYVSRPFVMVTEFDKTSVECQIAPVWSWHKNLLSSISPQASTTKYRVLFRARVPPLGLSIYTITATNNMEDSIGTSFAKITILTQTPFSIKVGDYPYQPEFVDPRDISISGNHKIGASFNKHGLLKSIQLDENSKNFPIHLEFMKYGVRSPGNSETSGAYLFIPDGPATPMNMGNPTVLFSKGLLESSVSTGLSFALHETILRNSESIEIRNVIDIGEMGNTEIVMKLSTAINSGETFYTDLNGFQIIKRERFSKIPLQANYYPISSGIFIEDTTTRLTLLSAQPLGGSSLKTGEVEIMQDRRLTQDDNRGLGQGVLDNRPTLNIFKLLLENRESCTKLDSTHPGGYLTLTAHQELENLFHPFDKLIYFGNSWGGAITTFGSDHEPLEAGIELAVVRDLSGVAISPPSSLGVVLYRRHYEECSSNVNREGIVNIRKLLGIADNKKIHQSPLTLLKREALITSDDIHICPMDVKGFIIER